MYKIRNEHEENDENGELSSMITQVKRNEQPEV